MILLALLQGRVPAFVRRLAGRAGVLNYLPPDPELRHNARQSLIDGMAYSVMPGFFNPFMGVFAITLGAANYMLGLLTSLPALTGILGQALGAALTGRAERRLPVVVLWAGLSRLFFPLFAALPFLPLTTAWKAWVFVAAVALMNLPASVAGLAWTSLMGKLLPPEHRGQVFGERNALTGAVTIASTALGGALLSAIRFPYNYTLLNLASFAFLMVSLRYLATLRETPSPVAGRAPRRDWRTLVSAARRILANRPYSLFVGAMLVLQFGLTMPAGVYPVLVVKELRMSTAWIGLMATAGGLSAVLTYRLWGRFADRHGHRRTLALSALVLPLGSFAYVFVHSPHLPPLIELVFGAVASGFNLSLFNYVLEVSPPEESPTYIAAYNIATSLVVLVAPMAGVWVMSLAAVRPALAAASAVRLAGVALLWAMTGPTARSDRRAGPSPGAPSAGPP